MENCVGISGYVRERPQAKTGKADKDEEQGGKRRKTRRGGSEIEKEGLMKTRGDCEDRCTEDDRS